MLGMLTRTLISGKLRPDDADSAPRLDPAAEAV
jgi:hypothetical protein